MVSNEEAKETGRIEAFSDGVFAVAITLLIFEQDAKQTESGSGGVAIVARVCCLCSQFYDRAGDVGQSPCHFQSIAAHRSLFADDQWRSADGRYLLKLSCGIGSRFAGNTEPTFRRATLQWNLLFGFRDV